MRLFLVVLVLGVVVFGGVAPVSAAPTPSPTPITCGIAGDPDRNKCCPQVNVRQVIRGNVGNVSRVVDPVSTILIGIFDLFLQNSDGISLIENLQIQCVNGVPDPATAEDPNACTCIIPEKPVLNTSMALLCKRYIKPDVRPDEYRKCMECAAGNYEQAGTSETASGFGGYYSAIGCVPTRLENFISNFVLRVGIGIAGMVSLACIIYSAILLQVSQGNPDTIQKARDQITSCIIGLLMIIFSIFILRIIGVEILRIPGFG
ncbi:MAG: pilin [Patescibacteria group bacterium]|nr:pilin [Patescibacteria group bacterium]